MIKIRVRDLVKEFSRPDVPPGHFAGVRSLFTTRRHVTRAVDGVGFDVDDGELVGFLGANGAGKSTTIKMLTGILVPTSGTVEVAGRVPWKERKENALTIGVAFGQRTQLWYDLPLRQSFEIIRDLYGVGATTYRRRLDHFTEMLELGDFIETPVRSLSLGQRMRGDLVAAMLYHPQILYLDEPTVGLDLLAKARIRDFVADINKSNGTTVVLTSHDMDDVEQLCDRVVVIDHGRVLYDNDLASLKSQYLPHREITVRCDPAEAEHISSAHADVVSRTDGQVTLQFDAERVSAASVAHDLTSRHTIWDLVVAEPRLEDVVRHFYAVQSEHSGADRRE